MHHRLIYGFFIVFCAEMRYDKKVSYCLLLGGIDLLFSALRAGNMRDIIITLAVSVPAVLLCLSVHEMCHGLAAWLLGDHTAEDAGRLTIDPFAHIDPMGFLSMLILGFGWARPVPVNTARFRIKNRKVGMAVTALAGPLSNFVLTYVMSVIFYLLAYRVGGESPVVEAVLLFCQYTAILSVGLGVFNLIPVYPLDGSHILDMFLPFKYQVKLQQHQSVLIVVLLALVWFGGLDRGISWVNGQIQTLAIQTVVPFLR